MQKFFLFINNHLFLFITWIVILITLIFYFVKEKKSKIKIINCYETTFKINKENALIFDIRNKEEYDKGHIINSININIEDNKKNNFNEIKKFRNNKVPIILIYNQDENNAIKIAETIYNIGFNEVSILKSGIYGWLKENLPVVISK